MCTQKRQQKSSTASSSQKSQASTSKFQAFFEDRLVWTCERWFPALQGICTECTTTSTAITATTVTSTTITAGKGTATATTTSNTGCKLQEYNACCCRSQVRCRSIRQRNLVERFRLCTSAPNTDKITIWPFTTFIHAPWYGSADIHEPWPSHQWNRCQRTGTYVGSAEPEVRC